MLFFPEHPLANNILCFTTSVHGGISEGFFRSFNLGAHVGDNLTRVKINRELLNALIKRQIYLSGREIPDINPIRWLNQQHSNNAIEYDKASLSVPSDAIYTDAQNVPLAVMTADCLPIVVYCTRSQRLAVIHAGYKGLMNNIISNTLVHFNKSKDLCAWIGPSIKQDNFQISSDLLDLFSPYQGFIKADDQEGKYLVDLSGIASQILQSEGVKHIQISDVCSYANKACFSHRRSVHQGLNSTGRMATVAMKVSI